MMANCIASDSLGVRGTLSSVSGCGFFSRSNWLHTRVKMSVYLNPMVTSRSLRVGPLRWFPNWTGKLATSGEFGNLKFTSLLVCRLARPASKENLEPGIEKVTDGDCHSGR